MTVNILEDTECQLSVKKWFFLNILPLKRGLFRYAPISLSLLSLTETEISHPKTQRCIIFHLSHQFSAFSDFITNFLKYITNKQCIASGSLFSIIF